MKPVIKHRRHLTISIGFSIALAAIVIAVADYYESPGLLVAQVLLIAGPTVVPFLVLPKEGFVGFASWLFIACLLVVGWSYVAYVDTRPYIGGGASFATLFGWFACFVALVLAALITLMHAWFGERDRYRN